MKKFFLLSTALLLAFTIQAQNYETIKNMVVLQQFKKAKEDLDNGMANANFIAKPEAYILKVLVYASLAADQSARDTSASNRLIVDQLITEADAAFKKYREMDPALSLITDPIYQNGPLKIYSTLYSSGFKEYESKNWQAGFQKFKKEVEYADLLQEKKIIAADTVSLVLAGFTAENANLKDEAAKYYSRIADMKVPGKDYESYYRFLVMYYFTQKDMAAFEKYKGYGKELYPGSEFFTLDKADFAAGLEEDSNKKL